MSARSPALHLTSGATSDLGPADGAPARAVDTVESAGNDGRRGDQSTLDPSSGRRHPLGAVDTETVVALAGEGHADTQLAAGAGSAGRRHCRRYGGDVIQRTARGLVIPTWPPGGRNGEWRTHIVLSRKYHMAS